MDPPMPLLLPGTQEEGLVGPDFVGIISITIHSYDIYISNRTDAVVCEDKSIWLIAGYIVDVGYDSVMHWYGVLTTSGDLFFRVETHKSEPPLLISTGSKANGAFGPWYLTVPGLFMIVHLVILSIIYP